MGLSSASIAATESQFWMSSSSSRLLSPIVPSVAVSPRQRFVGRLERGGGCDGRPLHLRRPPGSARGGNARDQLAVGANHRRWHDLDARAGIVSASRSMMSRRKTLPSLSSSCQMMMAWKVSGLSQSPADHGLAAGLDTLGDGDLALARKQFHRAHFAEIHAHGVVGALGGVLGPGFGRNGSLLNFRLARSRPRLPSRPPRRSPPLPPAWPPWCRPQYAHLAEIRRKDCPRFART